jgi:hypothetical protein
MNARAYTINTTKQETSADCLGEYHKGWTTYRIKTEKFLTAIGQDVTIENIESVQGVSICQEGKGDWGAYVSGELVGAGCSLNECFEYLINNHF